jgi:hypothetical protein
MKLYYVECKGMTVSAAGHPCGIAYVLANDPTEAYNKLGERLNKGDFGYMHERVLDKITLIAEEGEYPDCRMQLIC